MFRRFSFACLLMALGMTAALAGTVKPVTNRVVIVENDGKTVSGELIEATPAVVTVKPSPKVDPVTVPWKLIKRLSNGVTRAKILEDYRQNHTELLCDTCQGEGTVACDHCGGTGVDPDHATPCTKCNGTGNLGKCPRCKDGKIPCPNTCIKPSMFSGPPDAEGKRWHKFVGRHGTLTVSDAHLGQVVKMVDGDPELIQSPCPICKGTSVIDCPTCHGTALTPCPTCHGSGKVGPPCPDCKEGKVVCPTCDGSGMKVAAAK